MIRLLLLLLPFYSAYAIEGDFLLGSRYRATTDGETTLSNIYFERRRQVENLFSTEQLPINLHIDVRAEYSFTPDNFSVDPVEAYFEHSGDNFQINLGRQQFAFSETFGVNLMDILNPRDYSYSVFQQERFYRLSNFAVDYRYFSDQLNVELIWIPIARADKLPEVGSSYAIYPLGIRTVEQPEYNSLADGEGAVRINYLSRMGLEITLLSAWHHNRTPSFLFTSDGRAVQVSREIFSQGLSFSYAWESVVLRSDTLLSFNDIFNLADGSVYQEEQHWQNISGVDWSSDDGLRLAVQLHYNSVNSFLEQDYWISSLVSYSFYDDLLKPELMIFRGISCDDLWIRPKITINWQAWQLMVAADIVRADRQNGTFGGYDHNDQIRLELDYLF
jgi:hypothetical protein